MTIWRGRPTQPVYRIAPNGTSSFDPLLQRVFDAIWRVYGARKVWPQLRRKGVDVAGCTVARLMKAMGI